MKRYIELRPGEGGKDATLFANDLANAYERFALKQGLSWKNIGDLYFEVSGKDVRGFDNEAGGHRIQRVPPTERKGRVHTSTVTVAVLREQESNYEISDSDLHIEWYSGSGAGGQHRNKHQNSCRLTHKPTGIVKTAQTRSRDNSYAEARSALIQEIERIRKADEDNRLNSTRRTQIGSGMRGDKRRTYRFQDDQVVDHVTGKKARCNKVMNGNFDLLW